MESYKSGEINRKRNQARSQVVLRGGAIQRGDGPNEVGGASLGGGGNATVAPPLLTALGTYNF